MNLSATVVQPPGHTDPPRPNGSPPAPAGLPGSAPGGNGSPLPQTARPADVQAGGLSDPPPLPPESYRSLFDLSPSGIVVMDARGLVVFANPRLAQLLGREVEALTGRPALDLVAPESLAQVQQGWGRRLAGLSETYPCRFLGGSGTPFDAVVSASPILDGEGRVSGVLETIVPLADPGARKGGVIAEAGTVAVLDQLPEGVWLADRDDGVGYANPAVARMLGIPVADLTGRVLSPEFPADPTGRFRAACARARERLEAVAFTAVPLAAGGGRALLVSGWVVPRTREGRYDGMVCTLVDVTARARDETVVAARLEHFERVLGHLPAPVIVWNTARRISQVNPAFERFSGFAAAELLGRELGTLFPPAQRGALLARLAGAASPDQGLPVEAVVVHRDGQSRRCRWSAAAIPRRDNGEPLATVACVEDLTDHPADGPAAEGIPGEAPRLLEEMGVGVWLLGADGTTLAVNPYALALLGSTREELGPHTLHERVAPEQVAVLQEAWGRWLAGASETIECRLQRSGQGPCDCLVSAVPLAGESGPATRVLLTLTDLGERCRREEGLRGAESTLRAVTDHLPEGFLLLATDGTIVAFNPAATPPAGGLFARGLKPGDSLYLAVDEADLDAFNRCLQQTLKGQVALLEIVRPPAAAAPEVPGRVFRLHFRPVGAASGRPSAILVTIADVSEELETLRRLAQEREARRQRSSAAWQQAGSAAAVLEIFVATTRDLLGAEAGGLCLADPDTGCPVLALTAGDAAWVPEAIRGLVAGGAGGEPWATGRTLLVSADGSAASRNGATDSGSGPVVAMVPITSGARPDAWLVAGFGRAPRLEAADGSLLEALAAEAGGALRRLNVEEELRQQQAASQDLEAARARLFSSLAHELRTPVTGVMGTAELLHGHFDQLDATQRQELLGLVLDSARRAATILGNLELLGTQNGDLARSAPPSANVEEVVRRVIADARRVDGDRHPINFVAGPGRHEGKVDEGLLGRVVGLLLDNALRYSSPGSAVEVRLEGGGTEQVIEIIDQGIGVPEPDRNRIFEPFERGSNAGDTVGVGLGLALVRRLAEALGARVALAPGREAGSRFRLTFPLP
jgi:PAS domain S-box-containing protein